MGEERRIDRRWRSAMSVGIAVSIIAHAALLAWVKFSVEPMGNDEPRAALQVVPLPEQPDFEPDDPMQVIELADASAGGAATAAGPAPAKELSLPDVAPIPIAISEGAPQPLRFLETLEEKEEEEQPAARYARVSDFLVSSSAEPGPFRPIDDRPVDVLARIGAGRGTGMGVGVGGGHCPPRGGLPLQR